jgi:hypothetical protein
MTSRVFQISATAVLALALWVVPSGGTRGQGTLEDRFAHPDRGLVAGDSVADRATLRRADAAVLSAVAALPER